MMITNMAYEGNVTISFCVNGKKISTNTHNEGLPALIESFCKIMSGNYSGSSDTPQYIDIRRIESDGSETSIINVNNVNLSGASWGYEDGKCVTTFNAVITYDMLVQAISYEDTATYRLYLYSYDESSQIRDFARLKIDASDLSRIVPGVSVLIEWKMTLSNKEV